MLVAIWNIEKNGQSSTLAKQTNVSGFVDRCIRDVKVDVLFLCEVHIAREQDYEDFVEAVYGNGYETKRVSGGMSNNYLVVFRRDANIAVYTVAELPGLNRHLVVLACDGLMLGLAHFKSGRSALTKSQLEGCMDGLNAVNKGVWALTGDLNWTYQDFPLLTVPVGTQRYTYWGDMTQKSGGILDWCLYGAYVTVGGLDIAPWGRDNPDLFDMSGPDHRPVIFTIQKDSSL